MYHYLKRTPLARYCSKEGEISYQLSGEEIRIYHGGTEALRQAQGREGGEACTISAITDIEHALLRGGEGEDSSQFPPIYTVVAIVRKS